MLDLPGEGAWGVSFSAEEQKQAPLVRHRRDYYWHDDVLGTWVTADEGALERAQQTVLAVPPQEEDARAASLAYRGIVGWYLLKVFDPHFWIRQMRTEAENSSRDSVPIAVSETEGGYELRAAFGSEHVAGPRSGSRALLGVLGNPPEAIRESAQGNWWNYSQQYQLRLEADAAGRPVSLVLESNAPDTFAELQSIRMTFERTDREPQVPKESIPLLDALAGARDGVGQRTYLTLIHPFEEGSRTPIHTTPVAVEAEDSETLKAKLASFPDVIPAGDLRAVPPPPETDLDFERSSEGTTTNWLWWRSVEEGMPVGEPLGSREEAVAAATEFLKEHGLVGEYLTEADLANPHVSVASRTEYEGGGSETSSWRVTFPAHRNFFEPRNSLVTVIVSRGEWVGSVKWQVVGADSDSGEFVRLRPAREALGDLEAWRKGSGSIELRGVGEVSLLVKDVRLTYRATAPVTEDMSMYRVPVYAFSVEVSSPERHEGIEGTWYVVAAADVRGR